MTTHYIAIYGEGLTLTQRSENIIKEEFPAASLIRLKSIGDSANRKIKQPISLALVEQELLEKDMAKNIETLKQIGAKRFALAYHCKDFATKFYDHIRSDENLADFGFLPMNLQLDCWLSMLRLLLLDQVCVPQALLDRSHSTESAVKGVRPEEFDNLTRREHEILHLVAQGKQNKLIAADLSVSEHTVKLHMHHIMRKLGVRNRTQAARIYINDGQEMARA